MIRLDRLAHDTIVQRYAQTGKWCRTAELVFLGNPTPTAKHTATAPGKFPEALVRECEEARRQYLAGTFKERIKFADVPDEDAS
jgi:hypothetical protein